MLSSRFDFYFTIFFIDQESILYLDDSFFEEVITFYFSLGETLPLLNHFVLLSIKLMTFQYPVISFRKTPLLQTRRTETTLDKAGQVRLRQQHFPSTRLTVLI